MNNSLCTKNVKCSDKQKDAVKHFKGPLLIVAGPGAGKTRVLVERAVYLINKKNINPENILLITFTQKAAEELKIRLIKCIGALAENMQISTIHSFCHNILEDYSDYHELGVTFEVLDEETQLMFLMNHYENLGLDQLKIHETRLPEILKFFNECGENRISPRNLIHELEKEYPQKTKYHGIARCYGKYLDLMEREYKIDFPGLQNHVLDLLNNNTEVYNDLTTRYQFIMVDEYQDTNPIQEIFFELISRPHGNLCVVGDEDQSIYAFRGANPENFLCFEEKYKAKVVTLDQNFRSTSSIVNTSDKFMKRHRQYKKKIRYVRDSKNKILILKSENDRDEPFNVVNLIKKMEEYKLIPHLGYITLLFRSVRFDAQPIINELKKEGIPFTVRGDGGFLKREEIKSLLYLLSYVDPPAYNKKFTSWKWWNINLFDTEFLNLKQETIQTLYTLDKDFDLSSLQDMKNFKEAGFKDEEDMEKILKLNLLKYELSVAKKSILQIFYDILNISGYLKWLINDESRSNEVKLLNLSRLSSLINKYESINSEPTTEDFMWYLYRLPREMQYDEEFLDNPHSVKLLTVHQAKGLEFPVVFICSVFKGRFPRHKKPERGIVPIPDDLLLNKMSPGELEERRLFYVAMTRAQDILVLSSTENIRGKKVGCSSYIREIAHMEHGRATDIIDNKCENYNLEEIEPLSLSFSAINTYKECPFRYRLVYKYGFQTPTAYKQEKGVIIHNALYKIHRAMKMGLEVNKNNIISIVERCWGNSDMDDVEKSEIEKDLLKYYHQVKPIYKRVVSAEEPFSIMEQNVLIKGRTDLIVQNIDDELELIDFKARTGIGIKETSVGFQLRMYQMAMQDRYNFDKLCAYTFEDQERHYFPLETDLEKTKKDFRDICANIINQKFEATENSFCNQCVFNFCCNINNII